MARHLGGDAGAGLMPRMLHSESSNQHNSTRGSLAREYTIMTFPLGKSTRVFKLVFHGGIILLREVRGIFYTLGLKSKMIPKGSAHSKPPDACESEHVFLPFILKLFYCYAMKTLCGTIMLSFNLRGKG